MDATATLLPSGKVLIAGGQENGGEGMSSVATAELYDPNTGKFSPTGSMTAARAFQTATLLWDGRVLIAGGYGCPVGKKCVGAGFSNGGGALASAELYDPTSGKFSPTGSMSSVRQSAVAVLLPNRRVLMLSGSGYDEVVAELYEPTSGRFTPTGSSLMAFNFNDPMATMLPNGKVLVTGTTDSGPGAELYDPAAGKFTSLSIPLPPSATATPANSGYDPSLENATLLKDGHVLLYESGYLETYDPTSGAFSPAGFMVPRDQWSRPTATLLSNGDVLFEGGWNPTTSASDLVAWAGLYNTTSGPRLINSMHTARYSQTATLLPNGNVLIAGGTSDGRTAISSAELFKP